MLDWDGAAWNRVPVPQSPKATMPLLDRLVNVGIDSSRVIVDRSVCGLTAAVLSERVGS